MNASEQKNHRTVTRALAQQFEQFADAAVDRFNDHERKIGDERTHRLKLADEQRAYVDARDRELRECCQRRWDATGDAEKRINERISELRNRGFWSRLNWLLTGR